MSDSVTRIKKMPKMAVFGFAPLVLSMAVNHSIVRHRVQNGIMKHVIQNGISRHVVQNAN
jgi:hypothetical protein